MLTIDFAKGDFAAPSDENLEKANDTPPAKGGKLVGKRPVAKPAEPPPPAPGPTP
jgi:hypothetical protein